MARLRERIVEGRSYVCPTPKFIDKKLFDLSQQIINSGIKVDLIIAIARGGWALAPTLANDFGIKPINSLEYIAYKGTDFTGVKLITDLSETTKEEIEGKNVLILEDIVDSGNTVQRAAEYIESFKPNELKSAVLFWNDKKSVVIPDFYASRTKSWVVFPHEQGVSSVNLIKNGRMKVRMKEA